ncbi:hypothetical protein CN692_01830 [Bacillus sp. AFS002410]|uniref:MFS transporter n=1 Tax=Bacillus sp. AFS002410 TaxID=2033481 RepID=UPI000BEFD49D|nr:MFS transporter [Bacillus sp. AFS002410]PEJ60853.1 hypothetical protein CN692_01830 [Bacillus sp. AFS002410]
MKHWTKWVILLALFILAIINFTDKSITGLAGVHIMKDLNLTYTQFGIVGSSFFWLFSIAGIIGSSLSDRFGTGKVLALLAIIWTISQSMMLLVSSMPLLLVSRVLLGAGEGPFNATAVSHISKWFKPESRGFALSILNFGNVVGFAVSAPIVLFLISKFGWKQAFFVSGIVSFAWLICWLFLVQKKSTESIDERLSKQENKQEINRKDLWKALKSPIFIFTTLTAFITYGYVVFGFTFNPAYLMKVKGMSEQQVGKVIAIAGLIGAILSVVLAIVSDRIFKKTQNMWKSRTLFSAAGVIISGLMLFLYPLVNGKISIIIILSIVNTLVATNTTLNATVVISLFPQRKGVMTGAYYGILTSAGIVAPIVFGRLIESAGTNPAAGFNSSIFGTSIAMVISACFILFFGKQKHSVSTESDSKLVNI